MRAICMVPDCQNPIHGKGLCNKHRTRLKKYGNVNTIGTNKRLKIKTPCIIKQCSNLTYSSNYCVKHYQRYKKYGDPLGGKWFQNDHVNRFWSKVNKTENCWLWLGTLDEYGYGVFSVKKKCYRAHRYCYELVVGTIPKDLTLDHLCRTKSCVNPKHLEPVSCGENVRRFTQTITHCPQGHEYNIKNTYISTRGDRRCRKCMQNRRDEWRKRQRLLGRKVT